MKFVRKRRRWFAASLIMLAACDRPTPAAPTDRQSPPSPGGGPAAAAVARLALTIDGRDTQDVIVGVSEVTVDASASNGSGALAFTIDFGDGTTATTPTARHSYGFPGSFTITATIRDAAGQFASASQRVAAKTLRGQWFHAGYIPGARKFELRKLDITDQEGLTVRGFYTVTSTPSRPFTGRLVRPRRVEIAVPGENVTLEGTIPASVNDESLAWPLLVHGGAVDGQQLAFREIIGQPSAPPPDAVLRVRFDSFGSRFPILSLSPIQFDGSSSRGEDLTYVMEYGDGATSTQATTVHRLAVGATARLTVIDRFGRADSEQQAIVPFGFVTGPHTGWLFLSHFETITLDFQRGTGVTYQGTVGYNGTATLPFTATLSGERDISIVVPELPFELRGYVDFTSGEYLVLTQVGGAENGRVRRFFYNDGPG